MLCLIVARYFAAQYTSLVIRIPSVMVRNAPERSLNSGILQRSGQFFCGILLYELVERSQTLFILIYLLLNSAF